MVTTTTAVAVTVTAAVVAVASVCKFGKSRLHFNLQAIVYARCLLMHDLR